MLTFSILPDLFTEQFICNPNQKNYQDSSENLFKASGLTTYPEENKTLAKVANP